MAVTKRLRFEILRRDDHTCRYCGRKPPEVQLTVDHVRPTALGGTDSADNLVTACRDCNSGKSSVPADAAIVADVAEDAARWARALEEVTRRRALDRAVIEEYLDIFEYAWGKWGTGEGDDRRAIPRPYTWVDSVEMFYRRGLPSDEMERLVGVAMRRAMSEHRKRIPVDRVWDYFCGCCWRALDDLEAAAQSLIADENARDPEFHTEEDFLRDGFE